MSRVAKRERIERWPFSRRELKHPQELNSLDVLEADLSMFAEEWDADMAGATADVYRSGECEDPTIPRDWRELAEGVETLYHPETGEATDVWADVVVDGRSGDFVRFKDEAMNRRHGIGREAHRQASRVARPSKRLGPGERVEYWAFSRGELGAEEGLCGDDELIAAILPDEEGDPRVQMGEDYGVVVLRNGKVTGRYGNGRRGVTREEAKLAGDVEVLGHDGEETVLWAEVVVGGDGCFVRYVDGGRRYRTAGRVAKPSKLGPGGLASWVAEIEG